MTDHRRCNACGKPMIEGFCIHDGEQYYCSEECLYTVFTEEEYEDMYEGDEAYWTEWEDEEEPEQPALMRVVYKAPSEPPVVKEVDLNLKTLQELVGGYIEIGRAYSKTVAILCNEEGALAGLPYNCMGLVGPIVFVGMNGSDFRGLTDEELKTIFQEE